MEIRVQVKPGGSKNELVKQPDGSYLARTTAKPIDGQANIAVIKLVSQHFHVAKSRIRIKNGATSRHKTIEIKTD